MMRFKEQSVETDPREVRGVTARSFSRWSPSWLALAGAVLAIVASLGAGLLELTPSWLPAGFTGIALAGLAGAAAGASIALIRNGLTTLYLRYIWTRLNHHEASDILDRLS